MPAKKETTSSFFRPLLGSALTHAWYHRELWPVAAVAGLAGMGVALNDVLTQARLSSTLPGTDPTTFITSLGFTQDMLANIVLQGPRSVIVATILSLVLLFIGCLCVAWCQHIILRASHHALTTNTGLSLRELIKDASHPRIFRILIIDAFIKILILNIVIASGMLVTTLNPLTSFFDAFFGIIFTSFTLLLAFSLNIWGMLALVHIVKTSASISSALGYSWKIMEKNPTACIEFSLLLFAVTFALSLIGIAGLIIIGGMSIPFFGIVVSEETLLGISIVTFCSVVLATTWTIALAGCSTLVTYFGWTSLIDSLEKTKKQVVSRTAHHATRTLKHLFG